MTKAITFMLTTVDTKLIFEDNQILTSLKKSKVFGVSLMVGVVFHHVITFEDPHAYKAAVMMTTASTNLAVKATSQLNERQFTLKSLIINHASEDTGTGRD